MIPEIVKKSYIPDITQEHCGTGIASFYDYLTGLGEGQFASIEAVRLYNECNPLAQAVDRRARAFASLPIKIYDKKADEFIEQDHEVMELLERPNADTKRDEFLFALAAFYDITGNTLLTGTYAGDDVQTPPLEILNQAPSYITIQESRHMGTAGYAGNYLLAPQFRGQENYVINDDLRYFRWIEKTRNSTRDLLHIKRFNAGVQTNQHLWGVSAARAITLEMQQYIEGNKTNYGTLQNGIRPSGAFVGNTGQELTEVQWQRVKELAEAYKGAKGAGRVFAADGVEFQAMNLSNRDMEYRDLQKDMEMRIGQRYDIPLPLMSDKSATYNNYTVAQYAFYHDAVLPLADRLLGELTAWLMPKYKDSENLIITYDAAEVAALRLRNFEEAKTLREVQTNTDNELRTVLGFPKLEEGGDVIFKPANVLPAEVITEYSQDIFESNDGLKANSPLGRFVKGMLQERNPNTKKAYTVPEALELAEKHGIC